MAEDAAAIASIYAPYVAGSAISFETEPPTAAIMAERIAAAEDRYPFLVATEDDALVGYAYAGPFRTRAAYRFSAETSVYLKPGAKRHGTGRALYEQVLATLEAQHYVQVIAAIALPNPASIHFHEALGFTQAGVYRQIGYKAGGWHDVGLWQRGLAPASDPPVEPLRLSELGR